jgi:outer membrane protein assembly factor BamA
MVIHPISEHQWEDVNWNGEGHRSYINMELGTYCQLMYPGMVTVHGR